MSENSQDVKDSIPITSYCPDFALIPISALESLAQRFELGAKKYARNSWRDKLQKHGDMYVVERLNHVIYHAKKLQEKIEGVIPWDEDDDAGAILWGGALAAEAVNVLGYKEKINPQLEVSNI